MNTLTEVTAQAARAVLMVRPAAFGFNQQTAASNRFQQPDSAAHDSAARALQEFERVCAELAQAGVALCVAEDTLEPHKPDAVFPNNWVSFHRDGTVVLYPMQAANRRSERRLEILEQVQQQLGFQQRRLLDLTEHERHGRYLEGTGSLVLDHVQRIAYASRSLRTHDTLVREWARLMQYEALLFDARSADGSAPYHTNVLLSIGSRWAVVCAKAIVEADRARVLRSLRQSGREVIEIGAPAMQAFAGNMLELAAPSAPTAAGAPRVQRAARRVLALSSAASEALQSLHPEGYARLQACLDQLLALPIPTIERVGGGGVRCMLAEVP